MSLKIYVASSWRNERQPEVVLGLRACGFQVYDFRDADGFHWSSIDPGWKNWSPEEYRKALDHALAVRGFSRDHDAMEWADVFVGVQPCGRSASIEMGWAAGKGKPTILLLHDGEPELMVKEFDFICLKLSGVISTLFMIFDRKRIRGGRSE